LAKTVDFLGKQISMPSTERIVPCDIGSIDTLQTARSLIAGCNKTHNCWVNRDTPLPKRVLDVRNDQVHLDHRQSDIGLYACLSHRWSEEGLMLRTTRETLSPFTENIPWDSIPRTFQDAIAFTCNIMLPYLWIVSLCIIKDDPQDWQEQSGAMATIYSNFYITLAAACAKGPRAGIFT
jgi:hypothetical protein